MKHLVFLLIFLLPALARSQNDAKTILEKSYYECQKVKGGNFTMTVSKKSFTDKAPVNKEADCLFKKTKDSTALWKFIVLENRSMSLFCNGNELVQLQSSDSTGTIFSRNESEYESGLQNEGLFLPFFQPRTAFNLDRLGETTIVLRTANDELVMGKNCFVIHIIDISRYTRPNSEKQEKIFYIDKQSYLPLAYSELNTATVKNNNNDKNKTAAKNIPVTTDSMTKSEEYKLSKLDLSTAPHDSAFAFKNIPTLYKLKTSLGAVYHHHLKTGVKASQFAAKLIGRDSITLQSMQGKKILLCFFNRSSYPCIKSLNALQHIQDANKDAEVLLLNIEPGERTLSDLLKKRNLSFKAAANAKPVADDYFITAAPTFVIVDKKGNIAHVEQGFGEGTEMNLLKKMSGD